MFVFQIAVFIFELDFDIVDFRSDAEGGVGRQRPRRGSPCDDVTAVCEVELGCAGEVLDIAVATGLVEFVRAEACSGGRRVGLNGVTLVEVAFFVELFEQVPECLDVLVVVGDIGVVEVHPIAHLLGEVGPLARVFHHFAPARGVVFVHRNLLADILFGDAEHFLYAQFDGQAMGVPTGFTADLEALHGLEATESVLNGSRHDMVNTRHSVSRRRSFEEQKLRMSLACRDTFFKEVFVLPLRQNLTAKRR